MNINQYNEQLARLKKKFERDKTSLMIECAVSNNMVKIGDIIEDHIGRIEVDGMKCGLDFSERPGMIYIGVWFTKAGHKNKKHEGRVVYQHNIVPSE